MVNYNNGKIYKIISNQTDKIYIGSTTKFYLSSRFATHTCHYNSWKNDKKIFLSAFHILKYKDAKIILIENYPCNNKNELNAREQYWIEQNNNICINKRKAFTGLNKQEYKKLWYENNHDAVLENDKLRKPKLCIYCDVKICAKSFKNHERCQKHKHNKKYFKKINT